MHFKGHNGQVETGADGITIRRKGFISKLGHAFKGEKRIPYSSISAVQFRTAGVMTAGYIQFTIVGGNESRGALFSAASDENSVLFQKGKQEEDFKKLRVMVEEAVHEARSPRPLSRGTSVGDELTKLADLKDRGVVTEAEFEHQKARLLSGG
jgi:hypothetical protein